MSTKSGGNNDTENEVKFKDKGVWRDLTAYWILGLCNNYGYVIMLSAAHDIIGKFHKVEDEPFANSGRLCHVLSTGAILLADVIPAMTIKSTAPFLPFWVHLRIFISISLAASGFLIVAFATAHWMALLGVVATSFSCGLGETTFLAYSSKYTINVVSTWSSGTGGAGLIGSFSYAGLISLNITPSNTMLIMLFFPAIEAIAFWILLRRPQLTSAEIHKAELPADETVNDDKPLETIKEKFFYAFTLIKYMLPLAFVYLFEYFINQGLFELVYFEHIFLDKAAQYRWLNFDYQVGVFVSRSSVNFFKIDRIYLMSIFQFINVIYFLIEVIFYVSPSIWIVFLVVFWEGLLGGGTYVNTFYLMSTEISPQRRLFAISIVALGESYGITLAGFVAMPVHNAICALPKPQRFLEKV